MTITFPRQLPASFASQQSFDLMRVDYESPEAGGRTGAVQAGFPRWLASWTVARTSHVKSDEVEAFVTSMRGRQRVLMAGDVRRPYPLAHIQGFRRMTVGSAPFTGACGGWSQTIDDAGNAMLTLTGVPAGLRLSWIDYVGFRWTAAGSPAGANDRRALVRVVEPGKANPAGVIVVAVEPALPLWIPAGAVAHLDKPMCLMRLTQETKIAPVDRKQRITGSVISAGSLLLP
ncbi:hypothetical protein GGR39_002347 [Novosphingobium fluoreni]|uniref:Uncharacterized protein n=1 Tax=Novosphingobium fluoreni TaxID=1391222 RepID=A0A7W6C572_9SPHN|nr:hypothetical protein [Novosphingobium fluoreni]MBB3940690.1 hypothetical protein [Novosphingobium fluoreni]